MKGCNAGSALQMYACCQLFDCLATYQNLLTKKLLQVDARRADSIKDSAMIPVAVKQANKMTLLNKVKVANLRPREILQNRRVHCCVALDCTYYGEREPR